jgi:hypothetical protein
LETELWIDDDDDTIVGKRKKRYVSDRERAEARKESAAKWHRLVKALKTLLKKQPKLGRTILYRRDPDNEDIVYVYVLPERLHCYYYNIAIKKLRYDGLQYAPDDGRTFSK